jgi:septum formation inhibitor MinC|tara:strand:- start:35339 stop:35608 length:270 start_codon:yes stop_codon:yes gene_type:complete
MDKNEVVLEIANDILNSLNIGQIVNVLRDHSLNQANAYYDGLSDEQRSEIEEKILENRKKAEAAQKEAEEAASQKEEEEKPAEDLEVVS